MDNKEQIFDLELFRDILHICPRVHGQSFAETPFEEEILAFIHFLGHNAAIRTLTDVNINKLYQPWRSFAAIINKCLTGKNFVYQVEHKNQKKSNEMYYPRFTKAIIHHFMSKDPSIPRRNNVNWHYVRDDHMFSKIKLISKHQNTQQFGAVLSIELTNAEIRNSKAYKEYYAVATGEPAPKPKASVRRTRSSSDISITPPTAATSLRLIAFTKDKQTAKASKAKSLSALSEVAMTEAQQLKLVTKRSKQQMHISHPSGSGEDEGTGDDNEEKDDDGDEEDEGDDGDEGNGDDDDDDEDDDGEEGDDDDDDQEVVRDDDKDDDEKGGEDQGLNIGEEERHIEEEEEDELYRDVNINHRRGLQACLEVKDSHVTLTLVHPDGQQESSSVSSQFVTSMLNLTLDVGDDDDDDQEVVRDDDKDDDEKGGGNEQESNEETREEKSFDPIPQTPESSKDEGDVEEDQGLNIGEEERHIEEEEEDELYRDVNINHRRGLQACLEVKDSHVTLTLVHPDGQQESPSVSSQFVTSMLNLTLDYDHLRDESQSENVEFLTTVDENVKKIIKEQVKEQVKAQVSKILPRIKQVVNEQLEAKVLTQSSHSLRTSYAVAADLSEMELKKILIEKIEGNKSIQRSDEQRNLYKALDEEPSAGPDRGSKRRREGKEPESASDLQPGALAGLHKGPDLDSFVLNRLEVDTMAPELLAGSTYELMKGSCKSQQYPQNLLKPLPLIPSNRVHHFIPFEHFINNDLEYLWGGSASRVSHWGLKRQQFYGFAVNRESALDVYSKRRIIAVIKLKIVEWHSYKHLDWITVQRDDDKLYKFKEDLQLGVESYQKKLNLTKPDSYQSDLKRKEAYTAYLNPRGFIYQNKDKKNRLMRIDELHKFSDWTLTNVRTSLDDRLKGIRMRYLPQTIWRKSDKDRAAAMIQAIDKRLKTRRIMRSLERFIGGRLYEGDFRMLQRTI
uniref:Uncharacterized protein n=1 Tax=Tanacetum cinerariifolium TaxID=118510 RepID=A0A6L2NJN9_TANCI|nr:hypothetical protein [Tanacetum cinerariifolium]